GPPDAHYIVLERFLEKLIQATLEKIMNQFEYDKWCKIKKFVDVVMINKDLELNRQAAKIRDLFDKDLIEAYFQEKLASAKQLAKSKHFKISISTSTKAKEAYGVNLELFKEILAKLKEGKGSSQIHLKRLVRKYKVVDTVEGSETITIFKEQIGLAGTGIREITGSESNKVNLYKKEK
ncbi:25287_t:CDS:2, partial [Gigaspora margarita]